MRCACVVAPLVGAWIEIKPFVNESSIIIVAPLVGAWIEIFNKCKFPTTLIVAPLVGAWIEIKLFACKKHGYLSLLL